MKLFSSIMGLLLAFVLLINLPHLYSQSITPFQNRKGLYGYADSRGKTRIAARYDYAEAFIDSFAVVGRDGDYQILKTDGTLLSDSVYDLVWPYQQGYFLVKKGNKYAYLNRRGVLVRNFWFDRALLFVDNYSEAWQGNKAFLMYVDGNIFPYSGGRLQRLQEPVADLVHEMPRFPGGNRIRQEIISGMIAAHYGTVTVGMVSVQAVVEKDGSLSDIVIVNSLGEGLPEQVMWALQNMPPWVPARQNGVPVKTRVSFSLRFTNNQKS